MSEWEDDDRKRLEARCGTVIAGRYRLEAFLGQGTYGAVYRAWNVLAERPCAIKLFRYAGPGVERAQRRFLREARVGNRIRVRGHLHPNVVDVIDCGIDIASGCTFLVLELLRGETLGRFLRRTQTGRVPPSLALLLLEPIVDALATAHACGILHRDLKPDNIFLAERADGAIVPKLLDFGTGQIRESRITDSQVTFGTLEYLAPEAYDNARDIDGGTDVWALGVILQEMIAGELPFASTGPGAAELLEAIMSAPRRPLPDLEGFDGLDAIVGRCLDRNRARRFRTAGELLDAIHGLGLWSRGRIGARPCPPRERGAPGAHAFAPAERGRARHRAASPLRALDLEGHRIGDLGVSVLVGSDRASGLAAVNLARNDISDRGARSLAASACVAAVQDLDLRANAITGPGATALAHSRHLGRLARLDLSGNSIGDEAALALATSRRLASLEDLRLAFCGISPERARELGTLPGPHVVLD